MRLFVESSAIIAERWGIGQLTKRLVEAYHRQYPEQVIKLFAFHFFTRSFTPPIPRDQTLGYRLIRFFPGKAFKAASKLGIPLPMDLMIGARPRDIILFPNFVRWPLLRNKCSVTFVHDLSFELFGQYSSPANRIYMQKNVPKTIKSSAHIITISESSKQDIIKFYKTPEEKISIVYPFVETDLFTKSSTEEIAVMRNKFNLPEKYILFVSSLEPRKNLTGILSAYSALPAKIQKEYGLVLAGGKGWLNEDIHAQADALVEKGLSITRTGYVPDEDLPAMYSGATLFVFPSFYEGFGIPPLEAMACGVPVITSNTSSLPEVVGDAALLVDPNKPSELTRAIEKLCTDQKLCASLVQKGRKQVTKFSPEAAAQQLHAALSKLDT